MSNFPISQSEFLDRRKRHLKPLILSVVVIVPILFAGQKLIIPENTSLSIGVCMLLRYTLLALGVAAHLFFLRYQTKNLGLRCPKCNGSIVHQSNLVDGNCQKCSTQIIRDRK